MDQANAPGRKSGARKASAGGSSQTQGGDEAMIPDPATGSSNLDGMSFEQAVAELETLVARLESPELPLAQALASYQRGSLLMRHAQGLLHQMQSQIEIIESGQSRSIDRASLISQIKE